jgi:AraC-like DNA-binding protein
LEHRGLLDTPSLRVSVVRCRGEHSWSPEEQVAGAAVVLVRRGVFLRRVEGTSAVADVTTGYVQRAGECQQVAHPAGGDVCTSIGVPDELADRLASAGPVVVSAAADLAHRRMLVRADAAPAGTDRVPGTGDGAARVDIVDLGTALIDALLPSTRTKPVSAAVRRAVDEIRAALDADPALRLDALASLVGWSPWYLSRTFRRVSGTTVGVYRRTLRVRAALDELAEGGDDLATVAVRTGFADQAHLTRTMRREIDMPPATARRWLRGRPP